MTDSTIENQDVQDKSLPTSDYDVLEASDALLSKWTDAEKPSEEAETKAKEEVSNEDETNETEPEIEEQTEDQVDEEEIEDPDVEEDEDVDEDETDTEDDEDSKDKEVLSENALVEVKVGDETNQVSVKELTRLYGQEKALTQKSQQLSSQKKQIEQEGLKYANALETLVKRAEDKWKPYSEVDYLVASKKMEANEFQQLRTEANSAYEDYKFLTEEADNFAKQLKEQQETQLKEQAKETIKILERDIPNWNNELYNNVRSYAVAEGMDKAIVDQIVDPVAIKLIHKSRLYDEAKKKASIKKKAKPTTKVLKKSVSTDAIKEDAKRQKKTTNAKRISKAGNDFELVADALMERWEN
tara:strand:- start:721 stop:1788 length:1068 start_codon:yes stop_codon:yes gene_type:complete